MSEDNVDKILQQVPEQAQIMKDMESVRRRYKENLESEMKLLVALRPPFYSEIFPRFIKLIRDIFRSISEYK